MPTRPVQGGSPNTWGTELNAWLDRVLPVNVNDYGAKGDGVTDDTAAIQAAVDACNTAGGGTVVFPPGTFLLNSGTAKMVKLPRNSAGIRIMGAGPATVIKLSTNTPCAFGFNKIADYDTFQNIQIQDLNVDRNNVTTAGTHIVVGSTDGTGSTLIRLNLSNIAVRRVNTVNVSTLANPNQIFNVYLCSAHAAAGEGTQTSIKDIVVEDCNFSGGNYGVFIGGMNTGATTGVNVFFDRCRISRCRHDTGSTPSAHRADENFQIGSLGFGGSGVIESCYGANSGDTGVSIESATYALISNCEMIDAWIGCFVLANFQASQNPNAQIAMFTDCRARYVNLTAGTSSANGFYCNTTVATFGHWILRGCSFHSKQTQLIQGTALGLAINSAGAISRLTIEDFQAVMDALADTQSGGRFPQIIYISPAVNQQLKMKNVRVKVSGTTANTGLAPNIVWFDNQGATTEFHVEDVSLDWNVTGQAAGASQGLRVGASTGTMRGSIRHFVVTQFAGGDTAPNLIFIDGSSTLTIDGQIRVEDCDFRLAPASAAQITVNDNTNKAKVFFYNNRWRTFPKPSAAMGTSNFVAGTFTTATGNQYIGGDAAEIHFANGTGAAITKIEVSKDGTTYEEAWNQASGAMTQDVLVPVDNGDYVKVTFATTQPTTRVRFRK